jgi:hypothetical protein
VKAAKVSKPVKPSTVGSAGKANNNVTPEVKSNKVNVN